MSNGIEEVFEDVLLLSRLNRRGRGKLAKKATVRDYAAGETIVRQGDSSLTMYIVLSGLVRLEHHQEDGSGAPIVVAETTRAGFFGEMGLIDDVPRSATAIAVENTQCALLSRWDFKGEFQDDPEVALALLPVLAKRIRELEERLSDEA